MRCIAQQQFAFDHRLANQLPVAGILHIANAAVDQFGGTAGSALGEVLRVEQHRGKTASSGINRSNTGAGGAPPPMMSTSQTLSSSNCWMTAFSPRTSLSRPKSILTAPIL